MICACCKLYQSCFIFKEHDENSIIVLHLWRNGFEEGHFWVYVCKYFKGIVPFKVLNFPTIACLFL